MILQEPVDFSNHQRSSRSGVCCRVPASAATGGPSVRWPAALLHLDYRIGFHVLLAHEVLPSSNGMQSSRFSAAHPWAATIALHAYSCADWSRVESTERFSTGSSAHAAILISMNAPQPASIKVHKTSGTTMEILWKDGHQSTYTFQYLRDACPCATCNEEREKNHRATDQPAPPESTGPLQMFKPQLRPTEVAQVGNYAIRFKLERTVTSTEFSPGTTCASGAPVPSATPPATLPTASSTTSTTTPHANNSSYLLVVRAPSFGRSGDDFDRNSTFA